MVDTFSQNESLLQKAAKKITFLSGLKERQKNI